jgi:hypothetical protein
MVHQTPFTETEGSYGPYTYRLKGDDRVEATDLNGVTTMHQNTVNAIHWMYGPDPAPGAEPVLDSLDPAEAVVGGPDVTLRLLGSNFLPTSVIIFNNGAEMTTFVSDTELTTLVKASLAGAAIDVPVEVRSGVQVTASQTFSFTAAK